LNFLHRGDFGQFGAGLERAADIVQRRQQRLIELLRGARHHGNGLAPPAVVEQVHAARRALSGQFDAGCFVAQLQRQFDNGFRLVLAGSEGQLRFCQGATVERAQADRGDEGRVR
jgi:hypothetical protein